jgi:hypothetical protein
MAGFVRWMDCLGRDVSIDDATCFDKIVLDHAELDGNEQAIELTLVDPDVRNLDKTFGDRAVLYRSGVLPPPYHRDRPKVVVAYRNGEDGKRQERVVTAYAVDRIPRGEKRLWQRPRSAESSSSTAKRRAPLTLTNSPS